MRVIVAGSRAVDDLGETYAAVDRAIRDSGFKITELVSGGATGVDSVALMWAVKHGIPHCVFPAQWDRYGRSAGPRRNREMADYADALIALPGGSGTAHMIMQAQRKGLHIFRVR